MKSLKIETIKGLNFDRESFLRNNRREGREYGAIASVLSDLTRHLVSIFLMNNQAGTSAEGKWDRRNEEKVILKREKVGLLEKHLEELKSVLKSQAYYKLKSS